MTFYEAALRVLEEAAKPLTHAQITQLSIDKGLLSHVGKTPELTMLSRLAAMAKRPKDRRVIVTAPDTFALSEWQLPEDAAALSTTGVIEPNPEEALPPYRPNERHPESRHENVRAVGRQADRERKHHRRDREEEREQRRRKYPPIAEVAFEVLSEGVAAGGPAQVLVPTELLEKARAKELVSNELSVDQLLHALLDDNQRRIDSGRRPQFTYGAAEAGGPVQLKLDASETPGNELQLAFAQAAGVPVENGRVVLRSRGALSGGEPVAASALSAEDLQLISNVKLAGKDAKRAMARQLRQKLAALDGGTLEKSVVRMLHGLAFREVKVARRSKEGPVLTARRREGSLELRYAIRIVKGHQSVERRQIQELRRDLGHYGANVGLIVSGGEARGDARSEALSGALIFLWCGEGLAERFFEAQVGVTVQTVELYEIDEAFFAKAQVDAIDARARREERSRERDRQDDGSPAAPGDEAGSVSGSADVAGPAPSPSRGEAAGVDDAEGDDEGDDDEGPEEGAPGQPGAAASGPPMLGPDGQPLRKRRRRRRRRGRGPRTDQPGGAPGAPGAQVAGAAPSAPSASPEGAPAPAASAPEPAAAPSAPSAPPPSGGGDAS